jgi:hypothetical protein
MFPWELVEGHEPLPIVEQARHGLRSELVVTLHELVPQCLAGGVTLSLWHRAQ